MADTTNTSTAVNTISEVEVNALRATWDQAVAAHNAAFAAYAAKPGQANLATVHQAFKVERAANAAWKAGERALQDMWRVELERDEEARLYAMCAAHDADDEDYDDDDAAYHAYVGGIGEAMSYLDHHYHQDSDAPILALDGPSPYAR